MTSGGNTVFGDAMRGGETPVSARSPVIRFSRLVIVTTMVGCLWIAAMPWSVSSNAAPTTPAGLLAGAIHAAERAGWVHEVVAGSSTPGGAYVMINDIGTSKGRQVTVFANGGRDQFLAFARSQRVYEKANALGLRDYSVTTEVATYANKWMWAGPSISDYQYLTIGMTLARDFPQYVPRGPLRWGATRSLDGHRVRPIIGTTPAKLTGYDPHAMATLYVDSSGPPLPVMFATEGPGYSMVVGWSRWGQPVSIAVPHATIALPASSGG